jgi:hypothetical protein
MKKCHYRNFCLILFAVLHVFHKWRYSLLAPSSAQHLTSSFWLHMFREVCGSSSNISTIKTIPLRGKYVKQSGRLLTLELLKNMVSKEASEENSWLVDTENAFFTQLVLKKGKREEQSNPRYRRILLEDNDNLRKAMRTVYRGESTRSFERHPRRSVS